MIALTGQASARAIAQERRAVPGGSYHLTGHHEDGLVRIADG